MFLRRRQNGIRLLYFIASIVWDWGADASQDALARKVGLVPPSSAVAVAAASTLERVALPAPGVVRFRYCFSLLESPFTVVLQRHTGWIQLCRSMLTGALADAIVVSLIIECIFSDSSFFLLKFTENR